MLASDKEIYSLIGGSGKFYELVEVFYGKVENDQVLRPLFPEDLEEGKELQALFLIQRFGGPREYEQKRGHPMLRRRHFPFKINKEARDQWVKLMKESLDEIGISAKHPARPYLDAYFESTGTKMINSH